MREVNFLSMAEESWKRQFVKYSKEIVDLDRSIANHPALKFEELSDDVAHMKNVSRSRLETEKDITRTVYNFKVSSHLSSKLNGPQP